MVSLLLQYGARVDDLDCAADDFRGSTPLPGAEGGNAPLEIRHPRVRARSISGPQELNQIIRLLLDAGADLDLCLRGAHTPLHIACSI